MTKMCAEMFVRRALAAAIVMAVCSSAALAQSAAEHQKMIEGQVPGHVPGYYGPQPATEDLDLTMYQRALKV